MAGNIRLFEKDANGLLTEVPASEADVRRGGRRWSHVVIPIDVLWTEEEAAAHDAEETARREAEEAKRQAGAAAEAEKAERAKAARGKLDALGISADDLKDALGS